jgi:hypothetical protein
LKGAKEAKNNHKHLKKLKVS